jgi:hypothetical protein
VTTTRRRRSGVYQFIQGVLAGSMLVITLERAQGRRPGECWGCGDPDAVIDDLAHLCDGCRVWIVSHPEDRPTPQGGGIDAGRLYQTSPATTARTG